MKRLTATLGLVATSAFVVLAPASLAGARLDAGFRGETPVADVSLAPTASSGPSPLRVAPGAELHGEMALANRGGATFGSATLGVSVTDDANRSQSSTDELNRWVALGVTVADIGPQSSMTIPYTISVPSEATAFNGTWVVIVRHVGNELARTELAVDVLGPNRSAVRVATVSAEHSGGRPVLALSLHNDGNVPADVSGTVNAQGWKTGPTVNTPLRLGKGSAYEGGTRVPLVVKWPGVTAPGSVSEVPVVSMDYFPTILEIVDTAKGPAATAPARPANIDGESIAALLKGGPRLRRDTLYWHYPHYHPGSATPTACRPSGIDFTTAGASSVSRRIRETLDALIFSAAASSLVVANRPVSNMRRQRNVRATATRAGGSYHSQQNSLLPQSTENPSRSTYTPSSAGCRPSMMAPTMSGANSVSIKMR